VVHSSSVGKIKGELGLLVPFALHGTIKYRGYRTHPKG